MAHRYESSCNTLFYFILQILSPDDLRRVNADLHAADCISRQGHVTIARTRAPSWCPRHGDPPLPKTCR